MKVLVVYFLCSFVSSLPTDSEPNGFLEAAANFSSMVMFSERNEVTQSKPTLDDFMQSLIGQGKESIDSGAESLGRSNGVCSEEETGRRRQSECSFSWQGLGLG